MIARARGLGAHVSTGQLCHERAQTCHPRTGGRWAWVLLLICSPAHLAGYGPETCASSSEPQLKCHREGGVSRGYAVADQFSPLESRSCEHHILPPLTTLESLSAA